MTYLLDTCVISELVARRSSPRVVAWIDAVPEEKLYLSVITVGEIRKGIDRLPASRRRHVLEKWLEDDLLARFGSRILAVDLSVMLRWGSIVAVAEHAGRPIPDLDAMIAATAAVHNLAIVTRNGSDFASTGVRIVNPWVE